LPVRKPPGPGPRRRVMSYSSGYGGGKGMKGAGKGGGGPSMSAPTSASFPTGGYAAVRQAPSSSAYGPAAGRPGSGFGPGPGPSPGPSQSHGAPPRQAAPYGGSGYSGGGGGPQTSAPPSRGPSSGPPNPPPLICSGCSNQTVSNIIKGTYLQSSSNHNKPVYKKESTPGGVTVLMYFWDDRDGPSFSGWWFGPKVGGDQVWAYNGNKESPLPPGTGWKVPWDGPVDQSLRLTAQAGAGPARGRESQQPPPPTQPRSSRAAEEEDRRRRDSQRAEQQRREDEERRHRERERENERRRREREEEDRREQERRAREAKRRREEEEMRRREQAAVSAVRKVIQKVRTATPETYDKLRAQLEETQASNLEAMGSEAEAMSREVIEALQQAQKRIDEIEKQRQEEERRRLEEEKKRKEEELKVAQILKEMGEETKGAEGKVAEAQEMAKTALNEGPDVTPEAMMKGAEEATKKVEDVRQALEATSTLLNDKQYEMGNTNAAWEAKRDVEDLRGKVASGRRAMERLAIWASSTMEKASRKAAVLKKEKRRRGHFEAHDGDKDGKLSRAEVASFAKAVYDFELPAEVLDKIMRVLEPIVFDNFLPLQQKVAIAKSEAQARKRRAEEEERSRQIELQKEALQKVIDEANDFADLVDGSLDKAESHARPFSKDRDATAEAMKAAAGEVEVCVKQALGELEKALAKIQKAESECEATPELRGLLRKVDPLKQRISRQSSRAEKATGAQKALIDKAVQKAYAEIEQQRSESVRAIRGFMTAEGKTGEQLFEHIDGSGAALTSEKFIGFLKGLSDLKLADGQAEKVFEHVSGEAGEITKEQFLELIRLYYKCVKSTVLSEDISIKSKTVRRLEVGEVLEALEGPATEDGANVKRVRCLCVQDEATGWVTIAGNQGTAFLEPGGNLYSCVKETVLTDGPSVQDSKTVRRVAKGELIEVVEFSKKDAAEIKRIKGKAKLDGASGWITVCGNQGTNFLEPC